MVLMELSGLLLEKVGMRLVQLKLKELCWHKLEKKSCELGLRYFIENLRGCEKGAFSGKAFNVFYSDF